MNKFFFLIILIDLISFEGKAQRSPNLMNAVPMSPDAGMASKLVSNDADVFTGVPQIGVPIYSYSNPANSLSLNISLGYHAGGIAVTEPPSFAGSGWYLNAGGIITRVIRGQADEGGEYITAGFRYTDSIPNDWRSMASKYYNDSIDAEQDIFQYNFNGRSGTFYIGKNGEVAQVPLTKMKIETMGSTMSFWGFKITDESGVVYEFKNIEYTYYEMGSNEGNPLLDDIYSTAWPITRIIAPFNTDTIQFNYANATIVNNFQYPEIAYVKVGDSVRKQKFENTPGQTSTTINKIQSIVFPDRTTVSFIYDTTKYYSNDQALLMIKIGDSLFKKGFLLEYQKKDSANNDSRLLLKSVTPFTATNKGRGYTFGYNPSGLPPINSFAYNSIQQNIDHWGFYNGASNDSSAIPDLDGFSWQGDRDPNINFAVAGTLKTLYLPSGGVINYDYELNDHAAYLKEPHSYYFQPDASYSTNASFIQVFTTNHQITFTVDSSISRTGAAPFFGAAIVRINIKNTAGTITYVSYDLSLYDLFYHGIEAWNFQLPSGTYKIEQLAIGGSITGNFPVKLSWENKVADGAQSSISSGGLRIRRITKRTSVNDPAATITEYKYTNVDGTSSGFLGDVPEYKYAYRETVNYGGVHTTNYQVYSSDPLYNNTAGIAGYSRVEVINGTASHNSGKTVYEFTSPADVNSLYTTATFPYAPLDMRAWGLGYPKKISVYDSSGVLISKTTNSYGVDTSKSFRNKNFRSLKLGNSFTYINGDSALATTPRTCTYLGEAYYPCTGRMYLTSTYDTLYQKDGTKNSSYSSYTYDTNYNVIKVTTSYDKSRGLQLEKRMYYPYNYTVGDGIGMLRDSGIISRVISTEDWIVGDATPRILSGNVSYYHQVGGGYVLPLTVYSLQSNKPIPLSTVGNFSSSVLNRDSSLFVPQMRISSYDSEGNALEVKNVQSGISNSTLVDYNKRYFIAKVSNAMQVDIAYTSFESDGSGNWVIGGSQRETTAAITGAKSYNLSNGNITKNGLTSGITYIVSVWAISSATVNINGTLQSMALETIGDWKFYSTTITGATTATISGSGLIDELRLHPKDANMVTYTYNPLIGVTSAADANNAIAYNEYDGLNRLKLIRDQYRNIIKKYEYDDSIIFFDVSPHWVYKNNRCAGGDGQTDSVFVDTNLYSPTYNSDSTVRFLNYCTCATTSHPESKIVNGKCESSYRHVLSTYYIKVVNPDDSYYWTWKCVWRYQWSDGSYSSNYIEYNSSPCPDCWGLPDIE